MGDQVARFDPSKGIPDVLEAFRQLRAMFDRSLLEHERSSSSRRDGGDATRGLQVRGWRAAVHGSMVHGHD